MIRALVLAGVVLVGCGPKAAPDAPTEPATAAFPPRPEPGPPAAYTPPDPVQTQLSNGIPVYTVNDSGLPLVSVRLMIPTGSANDPAGLAGRAALGASMLGEGAGERTNLEQAAALEALAADLSFGLRREATTLALDVKADRLEAALPLAADALLRPRFDKEEWSRVHKQHLTLLAASLDDNRTVAGQVSQSLWWGAEHPYGTPSDGTPESAEKVGLKAVKQWHASELHAGGAAFVVVGDVTSARATELLNAHFGSWKAKDRAKVEIPAAAAAPGMVFIDRPGSTQTVFNLVLPGIDTSQSRAALDVGATIMGGSFTSRLNRRLREELGFTYGARMRKGSMRGGGVVRVSSSIRGDATADAMVEIKALLDGAASEGFTPAEVARGRAQVLAGVVDGAETRAGLAGMMLNELIGGQSLDKLGDEIAAVDGIQASAVGSAAKGFGLDGALIVLVGDKSKVEAALSEKGFGEFTVVGVDGQEIE